MKLEFVFFLATVAQILGQFIDARTTDIAIAAGFTEQNPIGVWLIKHVGTQWLYPIKCVVPLVLGMLTLALFSEWAGITVELIFAVLGSVAGVINFVRLRKAGKAAF